MVEPVITNFEIPDRDGDGESYSNFLRVQNHFISISNFQFQKKSWSPWTAPRPAPSSSAWSGSCSSCVGHAALRRRKYHKMAGEGVNTRREGQCNILKRVEYRTKWSQQNYNNIDVELIIL